MNLYEIESAILNCCIDTETGEVIDEGMLNALEMERNEKIKNIGRWIKQLNAEAEMLKKQEDSFAKRRKATENKAISPKNYLSSYLGGNKWNADDMSVSISFRSSKSVCIADENLIPKKYKKIEYKVDKTAIKQAIESGLKVKGASIALNNNIQIK